MKKKAIIFSVLVLGASTVSACGIKQYFDELGEKMPTYEKSKRTETYSNEQSTVIKHTEPANAAKPKPVDLGQ